MKSLPSVRKESLLICIFLPFLNVKTSSFLVPIKENWTAGQSLPKFLSACEHSFSTQATSLLLSQSQTHGAGRNQIPRGWTRADSIPNSSPSPPRRLACVSLALPSLLSANSSCLLVGRRLFPTGLLPANSLFVCLFVLGNTPRNTKGIHLPLPAQESYHFWKGG